MPTSVFLDHWERHWRASTDANENFMKVGGLMALAGLTLGHRHIAQGRAAGMFPAFYTIFSGHSSTPRKSTALTLTEEVIKEVDPGHMGPSNPTFEALVDALAEKTVDPVTGGGATRSNRICFIDELPHMLDPATRGGKLRLSGYNSLYDGKDIDMARRVKGKTFVKQPRVVIMSAATFSQMREHFRATDWASGFLCRCIFILPPPGVQTKPGLMPPFNRSLWEVMMLEAQAIQESFMKSPYGNMEMHLDDNAVQAFNVYQQYVQNLAATARAHGEDTADQAIASYVTRFMDNIAKIAMLYQIDMDPLTSTIGGAAMHQATGIGELLWASYLELFRETTVDLQKVQTKVLHLLDGRLNRSMPIRELRGCLSDLERRYLSAAIDTLKRSTELKIEQGQETSIVRAN